MRLTRLFLPTLKEVPKEAEVASHKLLLRGGFMRKVAAGIYSFLPMGWLTIRKIEDIIREEMNRAGGQEIRMPAVQPASLWKESKRWDHYGPELLRFKDRRGGEFCLGPTHEEVVTALVRGELRSYRSLPLNLYQIQTKFRDEIRPRAGLMRGREFIMKDAYSFDADVEGAQASYDAMFAAYTRIFKRCGLDFRPVEADSGNIGGNRSHEFQVLADTGEDSIVSCANCGYTANVEKAELQLAAPPSAGDSAVLRKVSTPGAKTIAQVAKFLERDAKTIVKTIVYLADGAPVAVLMRGDLSLNEVKLRSALGADVLRTANERTVQEATGAPVGFVGPIGLQEVRILADESVRGLRDVVVGANETDTHYVGVDIDRDVLGLQFADMRLAGEGDPCGRCGQPFKFFRGIEVGHVFMLGTKYSESMGATFLDPDGVEQPLIMGCYGIGVTRILSAAIEQHNDKAGMRWPMAIAPYHVIVLPLQMNDDDVIRTAETLYEELKTAGVAVMIDDRDSRAGVKFKDAELIGIPLRVAIGSRSLKEGKVELKVRGGGDAELVAIDAIVGEILKRIQAEIPA